MASSSIGDLLILRERHSAHTSTVRGGGGGRKRPGIIILIFVVFLMGRLHTPPQYMASSSIGDLLIFREWQVAHTSAEICSGGSTSSAAFTRYDPLLYCASGI